MILTCPNCGTQYVVKDGAIPPEGRQVRCAACKHSWHQNPEGGDQARVGMTGEPDAAEPAYGAPADAGAVEQVGTTEDRGGAKGAGADEESLSEAALIDPRSGPEAEERGDRRRGRPAEAAQRTKNDPDRCPGDRYPRRVILVPRAGRCESAARPRFDGRQPAAGVEPATCRTNAARQRQ